MLSGRLQGGSSRKVVDYGFGFMLFRVPCLGPVEISRIARSSKDSRVGFGGFQKLGVPVWGTNQKDSSILGIQEVP